MIVVFGSINVDLVIRAATLPRPGETVLAPTWALHPGGKGANQAVAAARAGASVAFYGCVGRDSFADVALVGLRAAGVDCRGIRAVQEAPTACAAICVDDRGENQIAVASGANLLARAAQVPDAALGPRTTVMLQLEVPVAENAALAARARRRGARVVLSAAPAAAVPAALLEAADVLLVNALEATMLADGLGIAAADPMAAAAGLSARHGCAASVTLGGRGAVAFDGGRRFAVGALPVRPVDTTAAGDAFAGALAAALDGGATLAAGLRRAAVAGGLACLVEGAQPSLPDAAAIDARLDDLGPPP
ncbi:MAG: PfkB family carbohydrate kinase [Rhodospirillales bacterium]